MRRPNSAHVLLNRENRANVTHATTSVTSTWYAGRLAAVSDARKVRDGLLDDEDVNEGRTT
jgi:hypothetical protein